MAIENIDLFNPVPVGRYKFVVDGVPEKFAVGNTYFRKWKFALEYAGDIRKVRMPLFASEYQNIILACGIGNVQGKTVEWNDEDADGCCFYANLFYVKTNRGTFKKLSQIRSLEEEEEYQDSEGI